MRSRFAVVLGVCCAASGVSAAYGQETNLHQAIIPEGVVVRDVSGSGGVVSNHVDGTTGVVSGETLVCAGQDCRSNAVVVTSPSGVDSRIGAVPTGLERLCAGQHLTQRISCLDPSGGAAKGDVAVREAPDAGLDSIEALEDVELMFMHGLRAPLGALAP